MKFISTFLSFSISDNSSYKPSIFDCIYSLQGLRDINAEEKIWYGHFRTIVLNENVIDELQNINLINRLFIYFDDITRVNHDITNIENLMTSLKQSYIDGKINRHTYLLNIKNIEPTLKLLSNFMESLIEETINILVEVRLYIIKDQKLYIKIIEETLRFPVYIPTKNEIVKERKILQEEIKNIRHEHQEKINNIISQ